MKPKPEYDTRHHSPKGIFWHGFLYEPVPQLAHKERLMIVEDHGAHLVVSAYSWDSIQSPCRPTGQTYRVNCIGWGKPTLKAIDYFRRKAV